MSDAELIDEAQGWCPECGGSGMVMEFGPTDCPNIDAHIALARLVNNSKGGTL
jgi:hypothetical protein